MFTLHVNIAHFIKLQNDALSSPITKKKSGFMQNTGLQCAF